MSDRDAFREVHEERRNHGLKARHETREARAVRKATAEEIAQAIEEAGDARSKHRDNDRSSVSRLGTVRHASYLDAARIAREIGSRDPE